MVKKASNKPIAILTCKGMESAKVDDRCQIGLFHEYGIPAEHVVWNELGQDWSRFQAVFIRSTWDYQLQGNLDLFLSVLRQIEAAGVLLLNPLRTIEWNCRKTYLKTFPDQSSCIESILLNRSQLSDLTVYMKQKNWSECVIKPIISAFGAHTYRFKEEDEVDIIGKCLLSGVSDWIMQPFAKEIAKEGEWSFVLVNGKCIHTILKKPAPGRFLVHRRHGGTEEQKTAPAWMIAFAEKVLAECGYKAVVARIDLIRQKGDQLKIMEIEAIDCFLWFDGCRELNEAVVQAVLQEIRLWKGLSTDTP